MTESAIPNYRDPDQIREEIRLVEDLAGHEGWKLVTEEFSKSYETAVARVMEPAHGGDATIHFHRGLAYGYRQAVKTVEIMLTQLREDLKTAEALKGAGAEPRPKQEGAE